MKRLLVYLIFTILSVSVNAQRLPWFLSRDTSYHNYNYKPPLYLLFFNGKQLLTSSWLPPDLNPNLINSINILNDPFLTAKLDPGHKYCIVYIGLKRKDKIALGKEPSLFEVYDKYHIALTDRRLPAYIDSSLISHPELRYATFDEIRSVKVDTESVSGIKFINIITIHPPKDILKPGEILIRGLATTKEN